jgi:hypothetical protein
MSSYVVGALIGVFGLLAGVLITTTRDARIRRAERAEARRRELQQAITEYLAVLDVLAYEAAREPVLHPTAIDRLLDRIAEKTGLEPAVDLVVKFLRRLIHGSRPHEQIDRLAAASARLRLIAPPSVEEAMHAMETMARLHRAGDEEWRERWLELRQLTRQRCRDVLDGVPEADLAPLTLAPPSSSPLLLDRGAVS